MDETSAKAAQKKAKGILPKVGYPLTPNTTDSESLARWYARVDIKADDFFGNVLQSTVNDQIRTWSGLGRRRDRQTWEVSRLGNVCDRLD
jgi:endothelin-converting enzyme